MINNLFRKYNQNRRGILTIIIVIVFSYLILQAVFGLIRSNDKKKMEQLIEQYDKEQGNNIISTNNTIAGNKSEIQEKDGETTINYFVTYCNQNKIEEAYNLLSEDCKEALFPNTNIFKKNYVEKIFNEIKTPKVEKSMYGTNIYKVTYNSNILASGNASSTNIIDYIYVKETQGTYSLSLNKFLYIKDIARESKNENVNIKILKKQVYIDYEIYNIQIKNNTSNEILIASQNDVNNICLIDEKNIQYPSYIDEMAMETLIVQSNGTKTINVKFNKAFNTNRKIDYIKFDTIMNYEAYIKGQDFQTLRQSIEI